MRINPDTRNKTPPSTIWWGTTSAPESVVDAITRAGSRSEGHGTRSDRTSRARPTA
jgi:hypothetical protein